MLKIVTPNAADGMHVTSLIKTSGTSRTIRGNDRIDFQKRAGEEILAAYDKLHFEKDEIPIHLIAMGCEEKYGSNRNADSWTADVLRACHKTFEKYARFYRDHANKNPEKSYGVVKHAHYNEPMGRVELICALNASESAAKRNGGLVADREMEKLANNEDLPVSMAVHVPYDVCSACGHKAKTRKEYCLGENEGGTCKAGGLRYKIGRLVELDGDAHYLHAQNPVGRFFDISHVFRPADRIAYVLGRLDKVANSETVSGAALADAVGLSLPYALRAEDAAPSQYVGLYKLAFQLTDLEPTIGDNRQLAFAAEVNSGVVARPPFLRADYCKKGQWLQASADLRMLFNPATYLHLFHGMSVKDAVAADPLVRAQLPGIYGRLTEDPQFADDLRRFTVTAVPAPAWMYDTLQKHASLLSLQEPYLTHRIRLATIRGVSPHVADATQAVKLAAAGGTVAELARGYAIYKLAFLATIPETSAELPLLRSLVSLHNAAA